MYPEISRDGSTKKGWSPCCAFRGQHWAAPEQQEADQPNADGGIGRSGESNMETVWPGSPMAEVLDL